MYINDDKKRKFIVEPLHERIKIQMRLNSLEKKDIFEKNMISKETFLKFHDGEYNDEMCKKDARLIKSILEIAKILKIPSHYLTHRIRYYNDCAKKMKKFIDKKDGLIWENFSQMNLFDCYKLVMHYETYLKISNCDLDLITNFCGIRKDCRDMFFEETNFETSLDFQLKNLKENELLNVFLNAYRIELSLKHKYKKFKKIKSNDENLRELLENILDKKLKEMHLDSAYIIKEFYENMKILIMIDEEDWNLLIKYYLLPLDKQKLFLKSSDKFGNRKPYTRDVLKN